MQCRLTIVLAAVLVLAGASARVLADDSDDTLRYYLSKADLVVAGQIENEPLGASKEAGVLHYSCEFKIVEVLKGKSPAAGPIRVALVRFEIDPKDKLPFLKQGGECILFLRETPGSIPHWKTADFWFGAVQYSPWMAHSLKRLAQSEAALHDTYRE